MGTVTRIVTIAAACLFAAGLAGCADGVDHSTPATTAPPISQGIGVSPEPRGGTPHAFPTMPTYSPMTIAPIAIPGGPAVTPHEAPTTGAVYPTIEPWTSKPVEPQPEVTWVPPVAPPVEWAGITSRLGECFQLDDAGRLKLDDAGAPVRNAGYDPACVPTP